MFTSTMNNGFAYGRPHNILSIKKPTSPGGRWVVYEYGVAGWDKGDNTKMRKKYLGSFTSYRIAKLVYPSALPDFYVSDMPLFQNLGVT